MSGDFFLGSGISQIMEDKHNSLFHFKDCVVKGGPSGAKTLTALSPEGATMEKSEKGGFCVLGGIIKPRPYRKNS